MFCICAILWRKVAQKRSDKVSFLAVSLYLCLFGFFVFCFCCVYMDVMGWWKCCPFFQEWYHSYVKGCFFLEDDGSISSLQYQLHIPQTTNIYLTIQPLSLSHRPGTAVVSYYTQAIRDIRGQKQENTSGSGRFSHLLKHSGFEPRPLRTSHSHILISCCISAPSLHHSFLWPTILLHFCDSVA